MESAQSMLGVRHVKISPSVYWYSVHLRNWKVINIRSCSLTSAVSDSLLHHYSNKPAEHYCVKLLNYMGRFRLVRTVPASLHSIQNGSPRNGASPQIFDICSGNSDAKIVRLEPYLFLLRMKSFFIKADTPGTANDLLPRLKYERMDAIFKLWDVSVAIGLYVNRAKRDTKFLEAIQFREKPAGARWILVHLFRAGANLRAKYDEHRAYLSTNIQEWNSGAKMKELMGCLLEISNRPCGPLLGNHVSFEYSCAVSEKCN